jgi:hypothetical protein
MDGRTNLLGRSGGYAAYMLVQFTPAGFVERDTIQVLSATLRLRAVTWFGDSAAQLGFNAYEISRSWGQTTTTWDSLPGLFTTDPGSLRGSFSGTVTRDTEWISIALDTAMVRRWQQPRNYSNNYGVILIPSQNTNVVRGFHAFDFESDSLYPSLTVVARNVSGTVTDTAIYHLNGQDTFVGNIDNLDSNPELIYVQSGVSYRGFLRFNVSAIPRGAIINEAKLSLFYNPQATRLNRFSSDTAVAAHALLSSTDNSKFELQGIRSTASIPTATRFVFDIRHQVQYWIRDSALNNGLLFRPVNASEFSSFDLYTFYNQSAQDSTKRPQLIVKYTVQSN